MLDMKLNLWFIFNFQLQYIFNIVYINEYLENLSNKLGNVLEEFY